MSAWAVAALLLAAFGGGCCGWVAREWAYAGEATRLMRAIRDGHARLYATMRDGRRYRPGRYDEENGR